MNWLSRTELLVKKEKIEKLKKSKILVVGLGGVGSFACEILVRAGIGNLTVVDADVVDVTNINRQLIALHSTLGKNKVDVVEQRCLDINPELNIKKIKKFISPDFVEELLKENFDCILDCIDTVKPKIELLTEAKRKKIKIISSMGAGGVLDSTKIKVSDISKTRDCMLAKRVRKELKKRNINKGIKVVYSEEMPIDSSLKVDEQRYKKSYYGTISYMPSLFGIYASAEAIKYLIK